MCGILIVVEKVINHSKNLVVERHAAPSYSVPYGGKPSYRAERLTIKSMRFYCIVLVSTSQQVKDLEELDERSVRQGGFPVAGNSVRISFFEAYASELNRTCDGAN
ncbi:hypothetical protein C7B65_13850 [Phormidesmis priestleyi ULC007]|uniref:Uncharacterized protein n=1 Tax=Phormidesmis priestleyi ULC007 TaxID=1920490 RepID=A0A2T1DEH4_9CYAN|nr:hypothetical protein C7B65_13850 [Phormidesmis priestleyi ULC007]